MAHIHFHLGLMMPSPRKKPHWTQTPAGKRKMSAAQKKSWAARRSAATTLTLSHSAHVETPPQASIEDLTAAACLGHISAVIDEYARRARIPSAVLAERVASLLHGKA